ncbi:hypothetical protein DVH24_018078 [Malus domestica]|uniref:Uncharacterized protein n=1 Tax=Malus domestica TaxID=3750 RepID=A0A498KF54_MALDO|nr:hypothetical protein DVH24_018078 [Malus domestica]
MDKTRNLCRATNSVEKNNLDCVNIISTNIEFGQRRSSFSCFLEWLSCRAAVLKHGQFDLLLVFIHTIWLARNSLLWNDKQENPIVVSRLAGLFLLDFVYNPKLLLAPCFLLLDGLCRPQSRLR